MALLAKIDDKETIKNVKDFFNNGFERIQRLSKSSINISSPRLDGMPKVQPVNNVNENKYIKAANFRLVFNAVIDAVNDCSDTGRVIIIKRLIQHKPQWQVAQEVQYQSSRYYDYYNNACLEFADNLEYRTAILGDDDLLLDLHAYQN